jgi:spermidine/putrescine transport system permease protein
MKKSSNFLKLHTWLIYAFLYVPIIILIIFSFNASKQTAVWEGFTFQWYIHLFQNDLIVKAVENSFFVASATAILATIFGTMCALAIDRFNFRSKGFTRGLIYLPMVSPEIVVGAALVTFFGLIHYTLDIWSVVFAHLSFSISYVAIIVKARLTDFDRSLEEASMDLGANPLQTFFRVTLPLLMPGIIAGALLVFTISMDDYVITSFVTGVGSTTLPLQIYSMIKVGVTPEVNAISTLLLALTIFLIIIAQYFYQKPTERTGSL